MDLVKSNTVFDYVECSAKAGGKSIDLAVELAARASLQKSKKTTARQKRCAIL
jgi:hypothetical protein